MKLLSYNRRATHRSLFLCSKLCLLIFLSPFSALAQSDLRIRVIDESAIPYMEFLSKEAFDQRFPGEIKTDPADIKSGWYVIYIHENLNYYFGPILLESTGQDYLLQFRQILEAAIAQRPDIEGFQLELRYDPSAVTSGNSVESYGDVKGNGGIINEERPDEAQQSSGVWGFIRRIFGF